MKLFEFIKTRISREEFWSTVASYGNYGRFECKLHSILDLANYIRKYNASNFPNPYYPSFAAELSAIYNNDINMDNIPREYLSRHRLSLVKAIAMITELHEDIFPTLYINAWSSDLKYSSIMTFAPLFGLSANDEHHILIDAFNHCSKAADFDEIKKLMKIDFFKKYVHENLDIFFANLANKFSMDKFKECLPELLSDFYSYFVKQVFYHFDDNPNFMVEYWHYIDENYATEVLQPMADLEQNGYHFPEVRRHYAYLLYAADSMEDMYYIADILVEHFDIPKASVDKVLSKIIEKEIQDELNCQYYYDQNACQVCVYAYTCNKPDSHFLEEKYISNLLMHPLGYEIYMNHLHSFLKRYGLNLFKLLIDILGPVPELIDAIGFCYELDIHND